MEHNKLLKDIRQIEMMYSSRLISDYVVTVKPPARTYI